MGVVSGCGCKEVYRFRHNTSTPVVSVIFCSSIPTFCSFFEMFFYIIMFRGF